MRIPLSFEPLEPRLPLAADAGFWGMNHLLAAEAASARVSLSARAVQVSDPGATFATALDLGPRSGGGIRPMSCVLRSPLPRKSISRSPACGPTLM